MTLASSSETAVFSPIISRVPDAWTSSPPSPQGHPADHPDERRFQVWRRGNSARKQRVAPHLFKKHREQLDGIVVTLPNFGDDARHCGTIRMAIWCSHPVAGTPDMSRA